MVIHLSRYLLLGHDLASALNLAQNLLALGLPDIALRLFVAGCKVVDDRVGQFLDGGEATVRDPVSQVTKEALDQIEPGGRGRREMHMEAGMLDQPGFHFGMLVRGVVVGNQMDRQVLWGFPVNLLEEGEPFLVPMLLGDGRDELAFQVVQRGEQGQGGECSRGWRS